MAPVPDPGPSATSTGPAGAATAAAPLGRRERMLLAAVAALLALLLFWLRGGLHPAAPLERLARQSPDLSTALSDGRPSLVEFYADWCEACRAMAPAMETIEQRQRGRLDVVLLNVDNPRWQPELDRYGVNGIPHLEFFNADGREVGRSIGARRPEELEQLTSALLAGDTLPPLGGVGASSSLAAADGAVAGSGEASRAAEPPRNLAPQTTIGPRSHG